MKVLILLLSFFLNGYAYGQIKADTAKVLAPIEFNAADSSIIINRAAGVSSKLVVKAEDLYRARSIKVNLYGETMSIVSFHLYYSVEPEKYLGVESADAKFNNAILAALKQIKKGALLVFYNVKVNFRGDGVRTIDEFSIVVQ